MSEASTTDDYATATENNSDGSGRPQQQQPGTGSFESGSSLYSLTRTDATEEQQVCNGQVNGYLLYATLTCIYLFICLNIYLNTINSLLITINSVLFSNQFIHTI